MPARHHLRPYLQHKILTTERFLRGVPSPVVTARSLITDVHPGNVLTIHQNGRDIVIPFYHVNGGDIRRNVDPLCLGARIVFTFRLPLSWGNPLLDNLVQAMLRLLQHTSQHQSLLKWRLFVWIYHEHLRFACYWMRKEPDWLKQDMVCRQAFRVGSSMDDRVRDDLSEVPLKIGEILDRLVLLDDLMPKLHVYLFREPLEGWTYLGGEAWENRLAGARLREEERYYDRFLKPEDPQQSIRWQRPSPGDKLRSDLGFDPYYQHASPAF